LRPLSVEQFLALDLPPRENLLAPWLPQKGLVMAYALRGTGKTLFASTAGYALGIGGEFLGFKAPRPSKVLYLDGEMPARTMQERLAAIVGAFELKLPDPSFFRLLCADLTDAGLPDLATVDGQREVDAQVEDAEVIIVDNLSSLIRSGRENEADSWQPLQDWGLAHRRAGRSARFVLYAGKGGIAARGCVGHGARP
jgi:RecA-family ATPase